MFIDTHMHEMTCSKDSFLKLEEMVEIAREKGLGAICITDHDDMGLKEYAAEYSKKTGFPIFVGIEFFSLQGDIIAFGIEEYPDERIPAQDFIDLVKAQGGSNFSGGQKQRLSIARAVARDPEILVFDDSFSALDYKTDRTLRQALRQQTSGTTNIIVAQRIGTIRDADCILVIEDGAIVGKGTHRELMESCKVYQEIAYSQLSKEELAS